MTESAPAHIGEVISRLRTIEDAAPPSDGVVCFARLYREVTEGVAAELTQEDSTDARFRETLDVRFAGLFFSALDSYRSDPHRDAVGLGTAVRRPRAPRHRSAPVRARGDERAHQP